MFFYKIVEKMKSFALNANTIVIVVVNAITVVVICNNIVIKTYEDYDGRKNEKRRTD